MDGDDAGKNAVERLCRSGILSKAPELSRVEISVATLPFDVKDPSDFIDYVGGGDKARERFQAEVLGNAQQWDEWFIDRIIAKYDENAKEGMDGCFSSICDEVSSLLATFPNPADRTRRAYKIAEKLADLIANDSDKKSSSLGMIRVQLESDILNMSSRKAGVREAMERRIEQIDGFSGEATKAKIDKLTSGESLSSGIDDEDGMMSMLGLTRMKSSSVELTPKAVSFPTHRRSIVQTRPRLFDSGARKTKRSEPLKRNLVPHFDGFTFRNKSDRDWLGLSGNGVSCAASASYLFRFHHELYVSHRLFRST